MPAGHFARGTGCEECRRTGFSGRFAISELLVANEEIRDQIHARANATAIVRTAARLGMRSMRDDGIQKALEGRTTIAEVTRVTVGVEG